MRTILVIFCICVALWPAQTSADAPPPGPLVATRAPEMAAWEVAVKFQTIADLISKPAGGSAPIPGETDDSITKTGSIIHVERHVGEKTWNIWISGSREVLLYPDGVTALNVAKSGNPDAPNPFYFDFESSDFPGSNWIAPETYTGTDTFQGITCLVFKKSPGGDENVAYINLKNRLPVALQLHGRTWLYTWLPVPNREQSLPAPVEKLIPSGSKQ